jgi:predicted site-specific integrase-resolvase
MKTLSTQQAARMIGVSYITLRRWLAAGLIKPSVAVPMNGGRTLWRWTTADVEKARKVKARQKPGPRPRVKR